MRPKQQHAGNHVVQLSVPDHVFRSACESGHEIDGDNQRDDEERKEVAADHVASIEKRDRRVGDDEIEGEPGELQHCRRGSVGRRGGQRIQRNEREPSDRQRPYVGAGFTRARKEPNDEARNQREAGEAHVYTVRTDLEQPIGGREEKDSRAKRAGRYR